METVKNIFEGARKYEPVPWDRIPDLGLYMDQVTTFIARIYEPLYGADTNRYLSAAMINNYVKSKLIPRPVGKKYSREQIALLTMIVALKQVSSMEDIRMMLNPPEGMDIETLYMLFCARHQAVIAELSVPIQNGAQELPPALDFAIISSGYRAGCEVMLQQKANQ